MGLIFGTDNVDEWAKWMLQCVGFKQKLKDFRTNSECKWGDLCRVWWETGGCLILPDVGGQNKLQSPTKQNTNEPDLHEL